MSLKIVVLAKQVPDTRNVGKDAMNADGTINRAALPDLIYAGNLKMHWNNYLLKKEKCSR